MATAWSINSWRQRFWLVWVLHRLKPVVWHGHRFPVKLLVCSWFLLCRYSLNFDSYRTAGDSREWGVTRHITTRFLHGMGHYSPQLSCYCSLSKSQGEGIERSSKYLIFQELKMSKKYYQMTRLTFVFLMMINKNSNYKHSLRCIQQEPRQSLACPLVS